MHRDKRTPEYSSSILHFTAMIHVKRQFKTTLLLFFGERQHADARIMSVHPSVTFPYCIEAA